MEYVISLPREITHGLYDYLDGELNDAIKRNLSNVYSKVPKVARTIAESPRDALGHLFTRTLGKGVETSSLIKMFGAESGAYVFEVPERWHRDMNRREIPPRTVDSFQEMELAIELARVREGDRGDPIDYHSEAVSLLRAS